MLAMKLKDVNWEDKKRKASVLVTEEHSSMIQLLDKLIQLN
jgi:hypothetical protein